MTDPETSILVTGATGFLGRRLCQRLTSGGKRVIAVGRSRQEGPWAEFLTVNLEKAAPPAERLKNVTTIFHLASKAHAVAETAAEGTTYDPVIVGGTRRLLEVASVAGVEKFIFMSSVKAMGEGNPPEMPLHPLDETSPHSPQGPYGLAKARAEELVLKSGLPHPVVLRPVMVYGPGEKGNLPRMVAAIRKGRFPPLPEGGNRRSMIHVDDLVEYCLNATIYPIAAGETYILSGNEGLSTRQLYDLIRQSLGLPPRRWSVPHVILKGAAATGTLMGSLLGKRMPLDLETLQKLTGSAWYSGDKAARELNFVPCHTVQSWLMEPDPSDS